MYHLCISSTANRCFSTVVPQCPWGIDSRISIDTVIHRCASSFCTIIPRFSFCSALFYCTSQILHFFFFFLQTEGLWQPCINQICWCHFPKQHLLTSCLCVMLWFGNSCNISNTFVFHYACYGDLQSVIFDVTIIFVWGHHELCAYKLGNLFCGCYDWPIHQPSPISFPQLPLLPKTNQY